MTEIIFKDNHIQTGHRVKIPKAIIDTLDLKEKQKIEIRLDANKKKIIVEVLDESKSKKKAK
jgi:bifunctional DNA-binding transcriptional regulator/antitoxin component of YhaV-PrlF toxin-antitoxin module|tara:strand:+ start:503 stop:688 length:186 start_codon:yes stop_codon:yes gene_type:complete